MDSSTGSDEVSRALKRRRVRRGTQSCWECKRRKVRCTFVASSESACDGCKSRQVKCIGQQFYEEDAEAAELDSPTGCLDQMGTRVEHHKNPTDSNLASLQPRIGIFPNQGYASTPDVPGADRHDALCSNLLAAWPGQTDIDLICSVPVSTSVLYHGLICTPYSRVLNRTVPAARDMLQLPPPRSHSILVARKLLLLAIFLQGIPRGSVKHLGTLAVSYIHLMSRLVEAASLVTSKDDLVDSLEGVECIMIESMYHNNAGNLRRAWITHRRAMVIAQMMGLHWPPSLSRQVKVVDAGARGRIDPEHMWYRLIITDRYLSLILGLPQCSVDSPFDSPLVLEECTSMERMERLESIAGGLILQRNTCNVHDLSNTQEIDRLLQEAAALMPPKWWLIPKVATIVGNDSKALDETLRFMNQFTHYHLLAQAHLPYLLQPLSGNRQCEYSKSVAVMASREILSRFVAFRSSDSVTAYCRGIDFLAFIASTMLSLAHIDARRHYRSENGSNGSQRGLGYLAHQRLSDRGLLEQTLQCMEDMSEGHSDDTDLLASRISSVLRSLLAIEAAAAAGASYSTSISLRPSGPGEIGDATTHDGDAVDVVEPLRIHIPHFGTVVIELVSGMGVETVLPELTRSMSARSSVDRNADNSNNGLRREAASGHQIGSQSINLTGQAELRQLDTTQALAPEETFLDFGQTGLDNADLWAPGITADVGDWALQGVDMALFNNLVRDAAGPGAESPWSHQ